MTAVPIGSVLLQRARRADALERQRRSRYTCPADTRGMHVSRVFTGRKPPLSRKQEQSIVAWSRKRVSSKGDKWLNDKCVSCVRRRARGMAAGCTVEGARRVNARNERSLRGKGGTVERNAQLDAASQFRLATSFPSSRRHGSSLRGTLRLWEDGIAPVRNLVVVEGGREGEKERERETMYRIVPCISRDAR